MLVTFNAKHEQSCTLLHALCCAYAYVQQGNVHGGADGVLDELNGQYEDDAGYCGLRVTNDGDVVFNEHMSRERMMLVTGRGYAHMALELLEADGEDVDKEQLLEYYMLAIVQRNGFVRSSML